MARSVLLRFSQPTFALFSFCFHLLIANVKLSLPSLDPNVHLVIYQLLFFFFPNIVLKNLGFHTQTKFHFYQVSSSSRPLFSTVINNEPNFNAINHFPI
jgi:hypothetical protein